MKIENLKLKTYKAGWVIGAFSLGVALFILYANRVSFSITNAISPKKSNSSPTKPSFLSGLLANEKDKDAFDSLSQIFLNKEPRVSKEEAKEIVRYVNQANDAIPLTSGALRFALAELVLGVNDLAKDALLRLEEGRLNLLEIEPPLDALVFHRMSIELLEEYRKLLSLPLTIPRDQFDPTQLEDDFGKLEALSRIAKRELYLLRTRYGVPLFPKVISLYDEALGIRGN